MSVMLSCTAWVINFPVVFPVPVHYSSRNERRETKSRPYSHKEF